MTNQYDREQAVAQVAQSTVKCEPYHHLEDMAFCIRQHGQEVYMIRVNGVVIPTTWNSKGAAQAGLEVEQRRVQQHRLDMAAAL